MIRRLVNNERGAAVIEIAVALPTLIILMWTIVQAGLVFRAMSGIQHGLGEGARYATLFPQPATADIKSKISSTVYGIGPGSFTIANPVAGTQDGGNYLDLQVTYKQDTDLLIIPGPTISVSRSKRVWVSTA
ncbi:MAG: TadE/TadG family type IV pilus assembly protein [Sphingomicrobium sp.]